MKHNLEIKPYEGEQEYVIPVVDVPRLVKMMRESDRTHQRLARWHKPRAFMPTARRGGKRK